MTGRLLLAALGYALVATLSQELLLVDGLAPVWAASGIAVAMVWRWGWRGLVVLLPADVAVSLTPPTSLELLTALGTASATLVEAAVGAALLRRLIVRPELDRVRDIWGLGVAAACAAGAGGLLGATVLEAAGLGGESFVLTWRAWAFGDAVGIVLLGGALMAWAVARDPRDQPATAVEMVAAATATGAIAAVAVLVAVQWLPLAFPLLVAAAVRGRARGTLAAVGVGALVVVGITAGGEGPFVAGDRVDGLISLQALIASAALTLLGLGAALSERERVTVALRATARARDRAHAELRRLALRDPLTGLPNRELLADRVKQALARTSRTGTPCGLVFVDVDRFKALNDAFGHARGDELLCALAPRIARAVRPSDTVARFGGDEFVVVCDGIEDTDALRALATRVLGAVGEPVRLTAGEMSVTASAGLALSGPGALTPEELISAADGAMYAAKRAGGGAMAVGDAASRAEVVRRHALENALRGAAARGELRLVYQPVFAPDERTVLGVEALVRWKHPQDGLLLPEVFIGLAESTGLIAEVGAWVLDAACAEAATWGADGPRIMVNLSARELTEPGLPQAIAAVLSRTGLAPRRLELELTETVVFDAVAAAGVLDEIAALGVRLALDDVGTGWSSLARVRDLPLSTLKIDRAFVHGLEGEDPGRGGAAVVQAIAGIGAALGLETVAEGVETRGQADVAVSAGATALQGFLLAAPLGAEELRAVLGVEGPASAQRSRQD